MTLTPLQPAATSSMLPVTMPPRDFSALKAGSARPGKADQQAKLHEQFTTFVGETFYGQMIKAMRSTVGKPAYFHGGRGEEVFRGQLDQKLAEHMTKATADKFADPLFHRQFPNLSMK